MKEINFRELTEGSPITVVTAWTDSETFEEIQNGHFLETKVAKAYFEPRGEVCFLRVFVIDGDGDVVPARYALENGQIVTLDVVISTDELRGLGQMISLKDRRPEFVPALGRAEKSKLEVYEDFEKNRFVVVNPESKKEYRVVLAGHHAKCDCPDFQNRRRMCKHIAEVMMDQMFGPDREGGDGAQVRPFHASCEFGNFKRQHEKRSRYCGTLEEAKRFIETSVGQLQGCGQVISGGEIVWEFVSDGVFV